MGTVTEVCLMILPWGTAHAFEKRRLMRAEEKRL